MFRAWESLIRHPSPPITTFALTPIVYKSSICIRSLCVSLSLFSNKPIHGPNKWLAEGRILKEPCV